MHDGSIATLEEVLDMYARGGRLLSDGPWAGDGAVNPNKSPLVRGFELDAQERADLLAWLASLSDPDFLVSPRFANPWLAQ
jgi:cytochrome c peroxidase